jgi:hypothetical protein
MILLALIIAFIMSLAFYALTPEHRDNPCPPERPVLVEDFSCVPTNFFEATFVQREGQK